MGNVTVKRAAHPVEEVKVVCLERADDHLIVRNFDSPTIFVEVREGAESAAILMTKETAKQFANALLEAVS